MERVLLAGLLALAVLFPGCVGSVSPAYIPQDALAAHDWEMARETRGNVTGGLAQGVLYTYEGNASQGLAVLSTNDLPILDEAQLLPALIEQVEAQEDVGFNQTGERVIELKRLNATVNATEYRVTGAAGGNATAFMFTPPCDAFAAVLGWGLAETPTGSEDEPVPYAETVSLGAEVDC